MKLLVGLAFSCLLALPAWSAPLPPVSPQASPEQQLQIEITDGVAPRQSQYYSYNFGNVQVNCSQWAYITLRNNGYDPVSLYGVSVYGPGFNGWTDCPYYLEGGQSCTTRVEFRPWNPGSYNGRLDFRLSSGNIYVDLFGWGVW